LSLAWKARSKNAPQPPCVHQYSDLHEASVRESLLHH
jgi:hypothetical protein